MFITCYLLYVSVFVTPSSGRPLRYLLKNCTLFAILLGGYFDKRRPIS